MPPGHPKQTGSEQGHTGKTGVLKKQDSWQGGPGPAQRCPEAAVQTPGRERGSWSPACVLSPRGRKPVPQAAGFPTRQRCAPAAWRPEVRLEERPGGSLWGRREDLSRSPGRWPFAGVLGGKTVWSGLDWTVHAVAESDTTERRSRSRLAGGAPSVIAEYLQAQVALYKDAAHAGPPWHPILVVCRGRISKQGPTAGLGHPSWRRHSTPAVTSPLLTMIPASVLAEWVLRVRGPWRREDWGRLLRALDALCAVLSSSCLWQDLLIQPGGSPPWTKHARKSAAAEHRGHSPKAGPSAPLPSKRGTVNNAQAPDAALFLFVFNSRLAILNASL